MSRRTDRINEQLREEISLLLTRSIKDPRLNAVVSITRVVSSSDLRSARVYISVMGNQETKQAALAGIQSAASYLRRELRDRINMKHTPFLSYELDASLDEADQLLRLMNRVKPDQPEAEVMNLVKPDEPEPETLGSEASNYEIPGGA
ncbi:MAG: 30S ribosome-binding factor RbfA [SAR202 cluster bacterium]|jgi:ribosome-binding factor A|nr:30S ribosome-binding factor RbfA [Dehalococcoidia bacterium]MQG55647.1 30S ribosome-binding factor RbfA [SAR202 cluster bacterium]|tara:strand:+ start:17918 stop:18361 length:444 start_codon:yes stop_codon:yes gene_type:complete